MNDDAQEYSTRSICCEMCMGYIDILDGTVYHVLQCLIVGDNPHEGWWRDHMPARRYLCDECYADHFHGEFDYGAPPYVPRYAARLSWPSSPRPAFPQQGEEDASAALQNECVTIAEDADQEE
jgi:hypothetical protein